MGPERWERVERIYHEALGQPPDLRAVFVERACGSDLELRAEVQSLLASHDQNSQFLERPLLQEAAADLAGRHTFPPGLRIGHYDLLELVAVGGMGEVYRAWDHVLERDVALKVLHGTVDGHVPAPEALQREGQAAARLTHPNICTVHEVDRFEGRSYLVMEYLPGRTLAQLLAESPFAIEQVLRYGIDIADALAHAHERSVLHKDLKSANVIVTDSHRIKVVDFGIARRLDRASVEALTKHTIGPPQVLAGTPAYMSPQLLRGEPADAQSDIWALGVLLHEMAAGELPFAGQTQFELAGAILHDPPRPFPPHTPRVFRSIVERCLAKGRSDRCASAAEVRDALAALYRAGGYSVPSSDHRIAGAPGSYVAKSATRRASPGRRTAAVGVAALVFTLGLGWWLLQQWRTSSPAPEPTLAVLPLRIEGPFAGQEYLGVGVADSIITRLAAVRSLRVLPSGAVARYAQGGIDIRAIARDLDVMYVLLGVVRRVSERFELTLRLADAADDRTIWEKRLDFQQAGLPGADKRVASEVVGALNLKLSTGERERLLRQYTTNIAADEAYRRGRAVLLQIGEQGVDAAVAAFQDALQLDPNHAPALAGLAMALVRRPWYASTPADRKRRYDAAMQAAGRASRIDPALAQAHEALAAVLRYLEFEWDKVIVESAKALELSPSLDLPHYNMAAAFYHLGLFDLADHAARAGLAANPKSRLEAVRNWGRTALYDSRFKHAEQWLVEVERVSDDGPRWLLGEAWYYVRDYKKSVAMLERLEASSQQVIRDRSRASLAAMLAARGDSGAAERRLKTFVAHSQPDHHVSHRIGTAYAQLRQPDRAVEWLRRAADTGFPCYSWFERDPLLDPIRTHPAFRKLLDDLRPMSEDRRTRFSRLLGVRF